MTDESNKGLFYTEPSLSTRMVEWACPAGHLLEPSAGDGSIFKAMFRHSEAQFSNTKTHSITAVELLEKNVLAIHRITRDPKMEQSIVQADFLKWIAPRQYDLVIANPPYEKGNDARHVSRMIDVAERVVILVRANFEFGSNTRGEGGRNELVFAKAVVTRRVVLVKRPKFYGPGNVGDSAKSDYVILELQRDSSKRRKSRSVQTERWVL